MLSVQAPHWAAGGSMRHQGPWRELGGAGVAPLPLTVHSVCLRHSRPSHCRGEHVYQTNRLKEASPGLERDKNSLSDLFSLILPPKSRQETALPASRPSGSMMLQSGSDSQWNKIPLSWGYFK